MEVLAFWLLLRILRDPFHGYQRHFFADSFDLREKIWFLPSKIRGVRGFGWADSHFVMETELITENPNIDLSEWQLAYYTYSRKLVSCFLETSPDPEDVSFSIGGNYFLLNAMLLN